MKLAIAILANTHLNRVAALTRYLHAQGLVVCVHVDAKVDDAAYRDLRASVPNDVLFANRVECGWGEFSLVKAEIVMCQTIFLAHPDVTHVQLISGDTLPIQSTQDLLDFLADNPNTDFIESFTLADNNWIAGGLGIERFTLYFPFSWKRQRLVFDLWVSVQRKLGFKRQLPKGLQPYIGSQWWCLTRSTIERILSDPRKEEYDRFFNRSWIADESYFQSLVRKHSAKIDSRSLVLSRFDHQGKPVVFYDDHLDTLRAQPQFFARKIWPGAQGLYRGLLEAATYVRPATPTGQSLSDMISKATSRRKVGRKGLQMQSRAPNKWYEPYVVTAAPYSVHMGVSSVFPNIDEWLSQRTGSTIKASPFADCLPSDQPPVAKGGIVLSDMVAGVSVRCHLTNLIWQYRDDHPVFPMSVDDGFKYHKLIATDKNATIYLIENAWLLDLATSDINNPDYLCREAQKKLEWEKRIIWLYENTETRATFIKHQLDEVLRNPQDILGQLQSNIARTDIRKLIDLPQLQTSERLRETIQTLKNRGLGIQDMLEVSVAQPVHHPILAKVSDD